MDRWCVSLDDLKQFKRLVGQAVSEGRICPTESLGLCIIYIHIYNLICLVEGSNNCNQSETTTRSAVPTRVR